MDELCNVKQTPGQGPQKHPIKKRPDWLWEPHRSVSLGMSQARIDDEDWTRTYIEHLEHNLEVTEAALSDAHTRLEGVYERHGPDVEVKPVRSLLVYNWEHVGNQSMFQCGNCKEIWTSTEGNPPPLECPKCTVEMRAY